MKNLLFVKLPRRAEMLVLRAELVVVLVSLIAILTLLARHRFILDDRGIVSLIAIVCVTFAVTRSMRKKAGELYQKPHMGSINLS